MAASVALPNIEFTSETSLLLRYGDRIDAACNDRVHAAVRLLQTAQVRGVIEIVPAYASLAVHYDPCEWASAVADSPPAQAISAAILRSLANADDDHGSIASRPVTVPVCYDDEFGADLADSSQALGIDVDEMVSRHCSAEYRVAMLGFAPGFPYLLGLDPTLQLPRRSQPRLRVPAGSVAIGSAQTGIYPSELPGGWNLIGRTPLRLFDLTREPAQWLNPGDRVRFEPITRQRYDELAQVQA